MTTRSDAASVRAGEEAERNDLDSLLRVVREHQRKHDDRAYDSSAPVAIRRCKTMLTKLRKLLPKLMRPIASLPTGEAVPVLHNLCQLLALLLGGGVCPHSMTLFVETGPKGEGDAGSSGGGPSGFSSYPTMATMLFYMLSFYSNERLRQAQHDVLGVTLQMVLFLQRNDVYAFIHFFRDTVQLLEDCFLLEECLQNRDDTDVLPNGVSIACFLDTAIHVYQDADGPLGPKNNVTLCGCMPIADINQLHERREQLKQLLPPVHLTSYGMVVALRQSMVVLAEQIVCEHSALVGNDHSFERLCQLVDLFISKNEALLKSVGDVCADGAVSRQEANEVTQSTLQLLHTMLQASTSKERRFVRLALTYFKCSSLHERHPRILKASVAILGVIGEGYKSLSEFAMDALWLPLEAWLRRIAGGLEGLDRGNRGNMDALWNPVTMILGVYIRQSSLSSSASCFVDVLGCVDLTAAGVVVISNIIDDVHHILSMKTMLTKVVRFMSKSLLTNGVEVASASQSSSSTRKRKRNPTSLATRGLSSVLHHRQHSELHEKLGQWMLDLVLRGSDNDRKNIVAISIGLRVLLPLRRYITVLARAEGYSISQAMIQRVDAVVNTFAPSLSTVTSEYLDLWIILLRYLEDHELDKYRSLLVKVLESIDAQQFFARNVERNAAFVIPDGWEYLDFLKLYQSQPRRHDLPVDNSDEVFYDQLRNADAVLEAIFQKSAALRGSFLMYFVWSRPKAFKLASDASWRSSFPWKIVCQSILQVAPLDAAPCSSIAMTPLLAYFVVAGSLASPKEVVTCILETFVKKAQRAGSGMVSSAMIQACGAMLCAAVYGQAIVNEGLGEGIANASSTGGRSGICQCRSTGNKLQPVPIPLALFEPIFCTDMSNADENTQVMTINAMSSVFEHCAIDFESDQPATRFVEQLLSGLESSFVRVRHAVLEIFVRRPRLFDAMIDPATDGSTGMMERLDATITAAEESSDERMILSAMALSGAIGCECDLQKVDHGDICMWILLRLTSLWNKFQMANLSLYAASAYDQICRITTHHEVSWRRLCVEFPELLYFPLVDELLETRMLKQFLRTFMGGKVDATVFLLASAPYVLPKYVVDQNERMLQAYVTTYNGTDEERAMYEDGSEGDTFHSLTITEILLNHIEYVLKDLIIHQVQADNSKNRLAEWEFLFKFLPENSTVCDVISHSPLRLMNLLAWELGGPQYRMAHRAFREVSYHLNHDPREGETKEQTTNLEGGEVLMPRQYFLALMTDLGNRISGKSSTTNKIRAIKSIDRLLGLFTSSSTNESNAPANGVVDPFVPKVMATLKIGLIERELQEHAIRAWGNFLRMLSTKALEANLSSIVVSLLPCLGYEASTILRENGSLGDGLCWNVESLTDLMRPHAERSKAVDDRDELQERSMSAAVEILRYLFIEKKNELKQAFPKIPLLPSIPELDEVYIALDEEVGDPRRKPLRDYLLNLSAYVNHWDMAVREMALMQLFRCLVVRGAELEALMQNEGDLFVDRAVADMILSVLLLARTENHEAIKLLCARCMGALGAIDGARMPLTVSNTAGGATSKGKVEHSTKDLACVLIERWLVKELRAAPENTDSVAFAIQELLRFLAELTADPQHSGLSLASTKSAGSSHKARQDSNAPMPEWMKRRFERKDVLQFVDPYWSTSYTVSSGRSSRHSKNRGADRRSTANADRGLHPALDDISYYEKYGTSYEEWLVTWCRRLIHLSQPPERKIFWACRTALPTCPQIARFLLPYLIQNVLRSGRPEVYAEIKKEVMAVLDDQEREIMMDDVTMASSEVEHTIDSPLSVDGPGESPEKAVGEYFRRHHQCSQTIFSTIEELNEWVWSSEKKRLALSGSASRQASASGRVDMPSELDDQEKENLEEFLKDIPSRSLSNAAYRIKAFARAIQYFEVYLRQQEYRPAEERDGSIDMAVPVHLSLIAKNAFYLQQLYKSVDEPDALTGLATLRRLYDANRHSDLEADPRVGNQEEGLNLTDLMHQIVDHEQLAQWEDALACYEQAIQEIQSALSSRTFYSARVPQSQHALLPLPAHILDGETHTNPELVKPELYSGMINCLIQLGRLESALQHINGIVTQEPNFMATLYPFALECSWRLSRWELLADLLSAEKQNPLLLSSSATTNTSGGYGAANMGLKGVDVSQLMLVRVLHSLHGGQEEDFQRNLKAARLEVMGPLAAASTESYQRAYPLLHKLHFLHEAEQGFIFLQRTKELDNLEQRSLQWNSQSPWEVRYDSMATPLKYRDPILALRRVILHEAGLRNEVSQNWLLYAKLSRKEGYIRTATSAVMHAEALDNQYALLEKAKLLVSQERMYEALQILEPVDIDASKLDFEVEDPHYCAKNLLLATNWMQESGQRQGKKVIERYQAVIRFDPKWEKGYFFLAKYYEYLLSVSHPEAMGGSMGGDEATALLVDSVFHAHLISLMKNYVLALMHGTKFVFQSLPRLLTLWFEYGEVLYTSTTSGRTSNKVNKTMRHIEIGLSQSSTEQQILTDITQVVNDAAESLPAYEWLVCFPQVTSRICHPNPVVVDGVRKIMIKVLVAYPTQAMWPLLGLSRSLNPQRRNRARDIISNTQRQFIGKGLQEIADSFAEGMRLVEELISLASHDPANQRKIHIRLTRLHTKILVPIQAALTTVLPTSGLAPRDEHHTAFSPNAQIYIRAFADKADVMMTKEKPKRIEVLGTDGQLYPFLCKREKTGDLRKDARMMEFNTMINKLLQKDREGRKRKLRLRTYAVVCLNEESGLMEWVRHTKAMRQLIGQIHKTERGFIQPVRLTHEIKERYLNMQKKYASDLPMMAVYYRRKVLSLPVFTPRFHQWFLNNFADPTAWFEARLAFSRSAAVWSMVGHIIGLGDRHGENILIDCTNGECVHVDFDCLFDKGLKLAKPEIVPFRLTPNIIDAFGITGYEGVFRRVCEVTMRLLRENNETLRSVLESFIHDPLVEWGRRGKTTQSSNSSSSSKGIADIPSERSKEETRIILKTIDDRLRGIYNLGDAIRPLVSSSHRSILPENETLPLSVQGQVNKLIHEATSHENLAQMYIGSSTRSSSSVPILQSQFPISLLTASTTPSNFLVEMNPPSRPPYDPEFEAVLTQMSSAGLPPPLTAESLPTIRLLPSSTESADSILAMGGGGTHKERIIHGPNGDIPVSILRPAAYDPNEKHAAILYYHPGGLVYGNRFHGLSAFAEYLSSCHAIIIAPEYRLAPEHPSPASIEDAFATYKWVGENLADLHIDPTRLMLASISGGGVLCAGVTLLAREHGGPSVCGQLLSMPMLDDRNESTSARQFGRDGGIWSGRSNTFAWTCFLGSRRGTDDVKDHEAPGRATNLAGLPSAYLEVGSAEVFRDEVVAYASKLWACGVQAELHVWAGGCHAFDVMLPQTELSKKAVWTRNQWVESKLNKPGKPGKPAPKKAHSAP
ncbi:hypothetical protein BBJ28_00002723 [Nothophytophthora sp. Chile5]|nr:hypothetical protein BBJ28_00002723 [Nothophytophthora sp. Chile5]